MPRDITVDQWLAELERVSRPAPGQGPHGWTRREISAALGIGIIPARDRIRRGIELGLLRPVSTIRTGIDGQPHYTVIYCPVKKRKPRRGK